MRLGLALGGGGARGLAHVLMLEVFDELGIKPDCIAGTSMGAVLGSLYASGLSASEIHSNIHELAVSGRLRDAMPRRDGAVRWLDLVRFDWESGGVLSVDRFLSHLAERLEARTFEQLQIPLKIVAADFWQREEVLLTSGDLIPAIQASMALPGVFRPVEAGGRMLVDGGTVNPVPFDLLQEECDVVVAVNVVGRRDFPTSAAGQGSAQAFAHPATERARRRLALTRAMPLLDSRSAATFGRADVEVVGFRTCTTSGS